LAVRIGIQSKGRLPPVISSRDRGGEFIWRLGGSLIGGTPEIVSLANEQCVALESLILGGG